MSDEPKAIVEWSSPAFDYRLLENGQAEISDPGENRWEQTEDDEGLFLPFLTAAIRRVREKLSENIGHLGTTVEGLHERIAEVERLYAQHLPRESVERNSLTERIEEVAEAVGIKPSGKVTTLSALHNYLAEDVRQMAERIEAVEVEVDRRCDALADRLAAVEVTVRDWPNTRHDGRVQALVNRVSALEARQEATVTIVNEHERWMLDEVDPRLKALEARQQDEAENRIGRIGGVGVTAGAKAPEPRQQGEAHEEPRVELLRRIIEEAYRNAPTGCGGSFGELLCYELHSAGCTFIELAKKWGVSLPTLGELIHDHCKRLETEPVVQQDEAGEGEGVTCTLCGVDQSLAWFCSPCFDVDTRDHIRAETAREIGDWLRGQLWPVLADRMEREVLGDEAGEGAIEMPRDHNPVNAPTSRFFKERTAGVYWRDEIRRETAREIALRLRNAGDLHAATIVELEFLDMEDEAGAGGEAFVVRKPTAQEVAFWKDQGGRERARDIAEHARELGHKHRQGSYGARTALNDLADWIEREFGGE